VEFVASKLAKSFLNDISDIDYSTIKETPVCSL
jgi:hypothetical protein